MPFFEADIVCESCHGTGLYSGMGEKEGAAVVCHTCDGTGKQHFKYEYKEFECRINPLNPIKRVYRTNPGICIGENKEQGITLKDFGGMPFKEWEAGLPFPEGSEDRQHTCPAWFYQSADYSKKPLWDRCHVVGSFSSCRNFPCRGNCWEKWDEEFGGEEMISEKEMEIESTRYLESPARCNCGNKVAVDYDGLAEYFLVECEKCHIEVYGDTRHEAEERWNALVGRGLRIASIEMLRYLNYHMLEDKELHNLWLKLEFELVKMFDPEKTNLMKERLEYELNET